MNARRLLVLPLAALAIMAATEAAPAQSAHDLFQRALRLERVDGDLAAANELFRQIANGGDRALAAQALLRIGENAERMGQAEARIAYERLVREFADQAAAAETARGRLAALALASAASAPAPRAGAPAAAGLTARLVWSGSEVDGVDVEGTPTPDGRHVTFVDWSTGDLAIRELATGATRRITNRGYPEYALFSSVSPDGQRVAFFWTLPPWQPQLRVIGIDGSHERVVIDNANREIEYLAPHQWTPDGKRVLVSLWMSDATARLAMVDVESGAVQIVRSLDWRRPMLAGLSPDGRFIAYDFPSDIEDGPRDIHILAADGSFERKLVEHPANDQHPVWSPDGGHVVFSSDRGGSIDLWAVRVEDGAARGQPILLKRDMAHNFYWPMGFTPGGTLFYAKDTGGGDIYLAPFDPATGRIAGAVRRIIERSVGYNTAPHISPDGSRVAYATRSLASSGGHGAHLVIEDLTTGQRVGPVRGLGVHRKNSRPRWSPDGRSVLVDGRTRLSGRALYRVDAAAGEYEPLVAIEQGDDFADIWHGEWLPDGESIVYETRTQADGRLVYTLLRRDLRTGEETVVLRPPHRVVWTLSPDGRTLAYYRPGRHEAEPLVLLPLDGGGPRQLPGAAHPDYRADDVGLAFTPDGRYLVYGTIPENPSAERPSYPVRLWRADTLGGEPEPLDLELGGLRRVSITPDGRGLLFAAGDLVHHEVWTLENVLTNVAGS